MGKSTCREPRSTDKTSQSPLTSEESQPLPNLPQEIIDGILLRLPVESLLRLRCVCKSWRSLISNPKFAKTHLCLASKNKDYRHHRLILRTSSCTRVNSCSLYSILNEKSDSAVQLDCPLKVSAVTIWGCCDGLVCLGNGSLGFLGKPREVFIWNPSTGTFKGLPYVEERSFDARFGFGYDDCIDDYKVVGFFFNGSEVKVMVYTLRSDSWRRIRDCPYVRPHYLGTFVNRALHWINFSASSKSKKIIVSLDLVKETYGEVSMPDEYDDLCGIGNEVLGNEVLGVSNGCLCILCNHWSTGFDIWVMKEYGIRDSWTMLVFVPFVSDPTEYFQYSAPVCILENGEVLLNIASRLVQYNPKDGTYCCPTIQNCSPEPYMYPYIGSLVSLDFDANSGVNSNSSAKGNKGGAELIILNQPNVEDGRQIEAFTLKKIREII